MMLSKIGLEVLSWIGGIWLLRSWVRFSLHLRFELTTFDTGPAALVDGAKYLLQPFIRDATKDGILLKKYYKRPLKPD